MRFWLPSAEVDFAVRRNTPESTPPTINSPTVILRLKDIGPDQRNQAIAELIRKTARKMPKVTTAVRWLGGTGGDGISSNTAVPVYQIVSTAMRRLLDDGCRNRRYTQNPCSGHFERNRDFSPVIIRGRTILISVMPITHLVSAVLCFGVGAYGLYTPKSVRSYVPRLRDTPGNRQVKRRGYYLRIAGTVFIGIGLWHLLRFVR